MWSKIVKWLKGWKVSPTRKTPQGTKLKWGFKIVKK